MNLPRERKHPIPNSHPTIHHIHKPPSHLFPSHQRLTYSSSSSRRNTTIYLTKHLHTNKVYVEKRVATTNSARREVYCMLLLLILHHPHLISIFAHNLSSPTASIYTQHYELGDTYSLGVLMHCLAKRLQDRLSEQDLPRFLFEGYRRWRQGRGCDGDPLPK